MRQDGVLIGTTGRHGNTLKIRPPLVFRRGHTRICSWPRSKRSWSP